jgi:hypothetical protein
MMGREEQPETCRVSLTKYIGGNLVRLVGFIKKKFTFCVPYRIVICGLPRSTNSFLYYIIKGTIF